MHRPVLVSSVPKGGRGVLPTKQLAGKQLNQQLINEEDESELAPGIRRAV